MVKGTGIWQHDEKRPISYNLLLNRFFTLLHNTHPDLGGGAKSYKIPPPQCLREGNKKVRTLLTLAVPLLIQTQTIFANIAEISKRMKRTEEHVTQFLFVSRFHEAFYHSY